MDVILTVDGLCKYYRHDKALDGLSLSVPKRAIYGLVGQNGSGKTTLIRLLSGLQKPSDGNFTLYGVQNNEKGIDKVRRRTSAIVETPAMYRNMTAKENLRQQYRVLGLPSEEGIDELLHLVGLHDTGSKKAGNFSLGMRQRLGIAIALAGAPDFLMLDEPVNGLDPQGIVEIRELLLKLNREKQMTILISSHILEELSKLATHYGFIDHGHMVKEITAKELEEACRKSLRLTVSDGKSLAVVLDGMQAEYCFLSEREAEIYSDTRVTKLVCALAEAGCEVLSINEKEESLESYYIRLIGGGRYEQTV
ncbi:MAG: ABC transporter ATP-binding protein [Lachnospiraceae bacterium]|nr:ABC transporter ATP-binding protein [Lachnospiraceae bacterium]